MIGVMLPMYLFSEALAMGNQLLLAELSASGNALDRQSNAEFALKHELIMFFLSIVACTRLCFN